MQKRCYRCNFKEGIRSGGGEHIYKGKELGASIMKRGTQGYLTKRGGSLIKKGGGVMFLKISLTHNDAILESIKYIFSHCSHTSTKFFNSRNILSIIIQNLNSHQRILER